MGSQEIWGLIKDEIKQREVLSLENMEKEQREKDKAKRQADIDTFSAGYDSQIANTQAYYDKRIGDTKIDYEDKYERNAVQKLINEKQIAEKNANLGLTDSGLNRTQQTAAQLSYANQKGNIDLARQSTLDELSLSLTESITQLQNAKASGIRDIENKWDEYSDTKAYNTYITKYNNFTDNINNNFEHYKDAVEAENAAAAAAAAAAAEVQKAAIAARVKEPTVSYGYGGTISGKYILSNNNGTLSRDYRGSLKDNGVSTVYTYNKDGTIKNVTYYDSNSGYSATFGAGVNPYTGKMNKDLRDKNGCYDPKKAFDNGYQPNNIGGKKLVVEEKNAINVNGQLQKVFKCGSKYYTWDGKYNEYFEVVKVDLGNGKHKWEEK